MLYIVESANLYGGPYCYVEAESEAEALHLAGTAGPENSEWEPFDATAIPDRAGLSYVAGQWARA